MGKTKKTGKDFGIKILVKKSLKINRIRNIFVMLSITLATTMFCALCLIISGTIMSYLGNATNFTAAYANVPENKLEELVTNKFFDKAGIHCRLPEIKNGTDTYSLIYMDSAACELGNILVKGELPAKKNQVVLQKSLLRKINAKVGDSVELNLGFGNQKYKVSGYVDPSIEAKNSFSVIVSRDFVNEVKAEERNYTVYVYLEMARAYSYEELNDKFNSITEKLNITDSTRIMLNDNSISNLMEKAIKGSKQSLPMFLGISFLVVFASGIVVYGVFTVFINNSIRMFGQLRAIGATKKQIKKMVMHEGYSLAIRAIPIGIVLAIIIAYVIVPKGFRIINTVLVCIASCGFALGIVLLSVKSPAQKAGRLSPVRAIKYGTGQRFVAKKNIAKKHVVNSVFKLAWVNFIRNKRKSLMAILTVSGCCTLFIIIATIQYSNDIEGATREGYLRNADFAYLPSDNMNRIENVEQLSIRLRQIEGLKGISEKKGVEPVFISTQNANINRSSVYAFSEKQYNDEIRPALKKGSSYQNILDKNGVILMRPGDFEMVGGKEPKIGDLINIKMIEYNIPEATYTLSDKLTDHLGYNETIAIPIDLLKNVLGEVPTLELDIKAEKGEWKSVENKLQILARENNLKLVSILEEMDKTKSINSTQGIVMYSISLLLFCFSLINIFSTTITDIIARQQEFGMLRAVGISRKRLKYMLCSEMLIQMILASVFSILVALMAGYFIVNKFFPKGEYQYSVPVLPILALFISLIIIGLGVIAIVMKCFNKDSIVEQINGTE